MYLTIKHTYFYFFITIFFFANIQKLVGQQDRIDSLLQAVKILNAESSSASLDDTVRINTLICLNKEYVGIRNYSKAIKYASIAKIIAEKLVNAVNISTTNYWLANAIKSIAFTFESQENYSNALVQYKKELLLRQAIGEKHSIAECLNKIGELYNSQDNLDASLEYYYKALKLIDETNFTNEALIVYNNIGITYDRQKNYSKSLEFYNKGLILSKTLNDKNALGISYSNIGTLYAEQGKNAEAIDYFYKFLKIAETTKNKKNIAIAYLNISNVYDDEGKFEQSFEMQFKAIKLFEELGSQADLALIKANLGASYLAQAKKLNKLSVLEEAEKYFKEALYLYQKIGHIESVSQIYFDLSELDKLNKKYDSSLENYKLYVEYRDSLAKLKDNERRIRAELGYEFEQKENLSKIEQEKKEAIAKQESEKQRALLNLFVIAFVFMVILAFLIYRNNIHKQKANKIISNQKREVEIQKKLVEEKQSQILSSINYAKRIQESILLSEKDITSKIPNLFITYIPKDIVSGDFYWYSKQNNESFIVVADCTGHGVPGAFLSMVGNTLLNEIINHQKISDPSIIIHALASGLASTIVNKEKDSVYTDGMDISICKIDHTTNTLYFTGANQSIYIVDSENNIEIRPQISSINGIFAVEKTENISTFEMNLKPNVMVYMSTDGYIDQIGEQTNKKFLTSRYEKLLSEIHDLPINKQKSLLKENFENWKGKLKQIDDVLVIGFKL